MSYQIFIHQQTPATIKMCDVSARRLESFTSSRSNTSFEKNMAALLKFRAAQKGVSSVRHTSKVSKRRALPKPSSSTKKLRVSNDTTLTSIREKYRTLDSPKAPLPFKKPWESQTRTQQLVAPAQPSLNVKPNTPASSKLHVTPRVLPTIRPPQPSKVSLPSSIQIEKQPVQPVSIQDGGLARPPTLLATQASVNIRLTTTISSHSHPSEASTCKPTVAQTMPSLPRPHQMSKCYLCQPLPVYRPVSYCEPLPFGIPQYTPIGDDFIAFLDRLPISLY